VQKSSEKNLWQQSLLSSVNLAVVRLVVLDYGHNKSLYLEIKKKLVQSALHYFSETIKIKNNSTSIGVRLVCSHTTGDLVTSSAIG